jgi:hypothetical protein
MTDVTKARTIRLDHLSPLQLKTLLGLAVRPERAGEDLRTETARPSRLEGLLTDLCRGHGQSGDLLIATLSAEDTPLEVVRGVKELAKRLVAIAPTEAHRDAARVLYHSAVAAGIAHHGVNVSSRPLAEPLAVYEDLAAALAGHSLGTLFRRAVERAGEDEGVQQEGVARVRGG